MACALSQGFKLTTCKGMAGLKNLYIIARADVLYQVEDADGNIVNWGLATGKKFFKYELLKETAQFTETVRASRSNESVIVDQEVTLYIPARLPSIRNEIMNIARNTVMVLAEDKQGIFTVLGRDLGLDLVEAKSLSGKSGTDRRGYELKFQGWETELAPAFIFNALACPAGPWGPQFTIQFLGGSQMGGCGGSFEDIFSYEFLGGGYPDPVGYFSSSEFSSSEFNTV